MNLSKTMSIEEALEKNYPIHVVYEYDTKEIVGWYAFGEKLAQLEASDRCAKNGPDTYNYAKWERYAFIRDKHEKHLRQLEEIESRL